MKTKSTRVIFILAGLAMMIFSTLSFAQSHAPKSVVMGTGYANDVFFKLNDGLSFTHDRKSWDIAFRTTKFSSSILTNDGAAVELFTYPNSDTTGWATMDTAGMSNWTPMYNDPTDWENGAFSRNASGHPDYGWGKYNDQTHDIIGDSVFILQTRNGELKKIWIQRKNSINATYYFKYANMDGSNEMSIVLDCTPYIDSVDFIGYNLELESVVNFQQKKDLWDICFTKYMGISNDYPYPVVGVLSNPSVWNMEFWQVPPYFNDWQSGTWDTAMNRSDIGYDWKYFDLANMQWIIDDSVVYFVHNKYGDVFKLYFLTFEGTGTGVITFDLERVYTSVNDGKKMDIPVVLYPNPASDQVFVHFFGNVPENLDMSVMDLNGRTVKSGLKTLAGDDKTSVVNVTDLAPGIYLLNITGLNVNMSRKIVVTR
jgi:hypothetical protein